MLLSSLEKSYVLPTKSLRKLLELQAKENCCKIVHNMKEYGISEESIFFFVKTLTMAENDD